MMWRRRRRRKRRKDRGISGRGKVMERLRRSCFLRVNKRKRVRKVRDFFFSLRRRHRPTLFDLFPANFKTNERRN